MQFISHISPSLCRSFVLSHPQFNSIELNMFQLKPVMTIFSKLALPHRQPYTTWNFLSIDNRSQIIIIHTQKSKQWTFYITAYIEWVIQITVDTYRHYRNTHTRARAQRESQNWIYMYLFFMNIKLIKLWCIFLNGNGTAICIENCLHNEKIDSQPAR